MVLVLVQCLVLLFSGVVADPTTLAVVYVTLEGNQDGSLLYFDDSVLLSGASNSDDSPEEVALPWPFPYFGKDVDRIFVDPNGAVHLTASSICLVSLPGVGEVPCYCNTFNGTSYMATIGGIFADMNPLENGLASVSYRRGWRGDDDEVLEVKWSDMPYFGRSEPISTFRIGLSTTGRVDIWYDFFNASSAYEGEWLSGLRPMSAYNASSSSSHFKITPQQEVQQNEWATDFPGVYPSRANVVTGKQFTACPVSTVHCSNNSVIPMNTSTLCDGNLTATMLFVTPASLSCEDSIAFGIMLASIDDSSPTLDPNKIGDCTTIAGSLTLMCDITGALQAIKGALCDASRNDLLTVDYLGYLAWSPVDSTRSYTLLTDSIDPLPLVITFDEDSTASCSTNYNGDAGACSLCGGDYTDFSLPCRNASYEVSESGSSTGSWSLSEYDDIYRGVDCNGTCYEGFVESGNGECCFEGELDCFGVCGGGAEYVNSTSGSMACCRAANIDCNGLCGGNTALDCFGVCGGTSQDDACGTCDGTVVNPLDCFGALTVKTSGLNNATVLLEFDMSAGVELIPKIVTDIQLTSSDIDSSNFFFELVETSPLKGPNITLPLEDVYTIQGHETLNFTLNASLTGFSSIEQKVVRIHFSTNADGTIQPGLEALHHDITFITTSSGCDSFNTNYDACIINPTCMFCPLVESMRVLKSDNRSLLNTVTPDIIGVPAPDNTIVRGLCTDRWHVQGCLGISQSQPIDTVLKPDNDPLVGDDYTTICMLIVCADIIMFALLSYVLLFPAFRSSCIASIRQSCGLRLPS
jgi:hypothetical protein